jgi:ribosomal protein L33
MGADRTVVLSCSSCHSTHYLTVGMVVPQDSATQGEAEGEHAHTEIVRDLWLDACITAHRASITLREMDVFQDLVLLRCADCRRHYTLHVSAFETHQR